MLDANREPSAAELAWFGLVAGLTLAALGAIIQWRFDASSAATVLWIAAATVTIVYYVARPARPAIYRTWMAGVRPLGWLVAHATMGLVYYLVLTPTALIVRLTGRDRLRLRRAPDVQSHWIAHEDRDVESYFRRY